MKMTATAGRRARIMTARPAGRAFGAILPIIFAANAEVAGMKPFGLSLFGALMPSPVGFAALAAGSMVGGLDGLRYILCAAAFLALGFFFNLDRITAAAALGAITAAGGVFSMLWHTPGILAAAASLCEGVTAGLLFYFFGTLRSEPLLPTEHESAEKLAARLVMAGACAAGLGGFVVPPGIHLNILFGMLILMFICSSVELCRSVTAGLVLGIMSAMPNGSPLTIMAVFAAGALFSSLMRPLGKWGSVLGMMCSTAVCVLCGESFFDAYEYMRATAAAIVIFAILPEFVCSRITDSLHAAAAQPVAREERRRLSRRLERVTRRHGEIYAGLKQLSDELEREDEEDTAEIIYRVSTSVAARAAGDADVSGDCFLEFDSDNGRHYAILCDGMGSGRHAYRESKMTAELLREFLRTGFLKDKALSMLNSALAIKGDDESFSTVDLLEIDLRTAEAEFLKIGSAQSFIRHRDELEILSAAGLPVGILDEVRPATISRRLFAGDIVVMVSDGVGEAGYGVLKGEWIKRMIKNADSDIRTLAQDILDEAMRRSFPEKDDDMTVAVLRVERAKKC